MPGIEPTTIAYDRGRLSAITQGARQWSYTYEPSGYVDTDTDPVGRTTSFDYDAAGRLRTQTLPDGRQIAYDYDANGNLKSVTPPSRPPHGFTHNGVDQRASYDPPDLGAGPESTTYTYNDDHDLTKVTRADGSELSFGYDAAGRPKTITEPGGTNVTTLNYDAQSGHLSSIDAPGPISVAFQDDGLLPIQETFSGLISGSVSRDYDSRLRLASTSVNGQDPIAYGYDNEDLLTSAGAETISRDPNNGLITGTTLGQSTDTQTYSVFAEPDVYTAKQGTDTVYAVDYDRDEAGRVIKKNEMVGGSTTVSQYTYWPNGELKEVKDQADAVLSSYAYDSNGNRTSVSRAGEPQLTATYDDQDRLETYGDYSYSYTPNGDLQQKTNTTNNQITTYSYDALGNLDQVTLPSGIQIGYLTDGLGRRVGRFEGASLTHAFLYGSEARGPAAELDEQGNVRSRFVYGTSSRVPDYMVRGGNTYRIVRDQLDSVRLVVDTSTSEVAQELRYDEFGRVLEDTHPGFQPLGFAGGLYDSATGLVRFGARDYDAETGRWTAKDPILFAGGQANLYGYVLNDPINLTDPSGRVIPLVVGIVVGAGVIGGGAKAIDQLDECDDSFLDVLEAGGRGFISGSSGATVGVAVGAVAGPYAGGAAGGAAGGFIDRQLEDEETSPGDVLVDSSLGALSGGAANKALPTRGFEPDLLNPSGALSKSPLGKNSQRLIGQEALSEALESGFDLVDHECTC